MKPQSVKRAAERLEPVKKYVEACWNSPKRYHVFCLVEGEFDKRIYEARLNDREIEVKIAADDNLHHNRSSVQYLVGDLRAMHPQGRFIGIRDKDYMVLMGHGCPDGIYVTDNRDLEMMVLASPSFQASDSNLVPYMTTLFQYCVPFAHIRIYAERRNLRNRLNDKMNIAVVYDQQSKTFVSDVRVTLQSLYVSEVDAGSSAVDIDTFVATEGLADLSPYDICRGHDVIGLLEFVYGNFYSKSAMERNMKINYSKTDFYMTSLFAEIQQYCQTFGIDAKV